MANQLSITLKKSVIGAKKNQKDTIKALGLTKIRQNVIHKDNESIRGMIEKVAHLIDVQEQ